MKFNNRNVQLIGSNIKIGSNVKIGDNTTIYNNVIIEDNTIICNDCIIGEPLGSYYKNINTYENPPTLIGQDSLIRSHCIVYAGSKLGKNLTTGHRVTIRENTNIGDNCLISTLVDIQGNCSIGNFTRVYSNVHISELTKIGNYVFIFPYTIFTNDPQPPSDNLVGSTVGDYSLITVHCVILPGINIGNNCLVGANSTVTKDIDNYSFCVGSPAKLICDIRNIKSKKDDQNYYPWVYNFDRGLPWQNMEYDEWLKSQSIYK